MVNIKSAVKALVLADVVSQIPICRIDIKAHFYTPFGVVCWMRYLALPLGELAAEPTERGLPLPLGEVAEHSEDGEGNL